MSAWWDEGTFQGQARALMRSIRRVRDDGAWVVSLVWLRARRRVPGRKLSAYAKQRAETRALARLLADDPVLRAAFESALRLDTKGALTFVNNLVATPPAAPLTHEQREARRREGVRRKAVLREHNAREKLSAWEGKLARAKTAVARWRKVVARYDKKKACS